jgi:hypothetical protein
VYVQDHFEAAAADEVLGLLAARRLNVDFDYIACRLCRIRSGHDLYEKYGLSANRIIEKLKLTRK